MLHMTGDEGSGAFQSVGNVMLEDLLGTEGHPRPFSPCVRFMGRSFQD